MAVAMYIVLCSITALLWYFTRFRKRNLNGVELPPGPPCVPILGNIHQFAKNAPVILSKYARQYGQMYTLYLGSNTPVLVVNDVQLMKQIFGTLPSTGKLFNPWFDLIFEGEYGLIYTDGKTWQEQRIFLQKTLKDFGFGSKVSSHLESMILQEIRKLSDRMEKDMQTKGVVHLAEFLKEYAGGTVWALVTGKSITPQMAQLIDESVHITRKVVNSGLVFFSWLKYIAPKWSGYTAGKDVARRLHKMVADSFVEHQQKGEIDGQQDLVSAFITHTDKMKDSPNSVFFGTIGQFHNIKTILALLGAGVETTASTINWLLFYLCVHPDIQKKLQREIDDELEDGRDPNFTDKERMVYTEAVILEVLRLSSVLPFGLIHKLTDDITIQGQKLPKGLALMANTYHVHHDATIWGDPDVFRPERFLETFEDGGGVTSTKIISNLRDSVVAFQPGRRTCVGEPLARDAIFLFLVKLCQTFNFLPEDGRTKEEYMEPCIHLLLQPKNFGIRVVNRKQDGK